MLQQVDMTKLFIIRTDVSENALVEVLLQRQGPKEHPVENARRLLNSAARK